MIALLTGWLGNAWAKIAAAGVIVGAVLLGVARVFSAGKQAAKEEGERKQLENVATRNEVDSSVATGSPDANRERLSKWTRG